MRNIGLLISELNKGGAEHVVSRLSFILKNDYKIYVILFEDTYMEYEVHGQLVNLDIPASKSNSKLKLLYQRVRKLRRKKKELCLDCVISFLDSPNIVNILSRTGKCKTVVSVRNYSKAENTRIRIGKIVNFAYKILYKKADKVVAVTRVIADLYEKTYGVPREKIIVINNPYDIAEIKKQERLPITVGLPHSEGKIVFITVGRQMYQKGYWHLLKAFNFVHKNNPNTLLFMVGETENRIEQLIKALQLSDCVYNYGKQENPFAILAKGDIYVLSSLYEGFPNAMVEGMACGLPIIAADCKSGPREILAPNSDINTKCTDIEYAQYGILVPALEPEENWDIDIFTDAEKQLANAMQILANDSISKENYAKKAEKRANDFGYKKCRMNFINMLENM